MIDDLEAPKPDFELRIDFKERLYKLRDRIKYLCLEVPVNCDCLKCLRINDQFEKFLLESKKGVYELEVKKMDEPFKDIEIVKQEIAERIEEPAPIPERRGRGRQPGQKPCPKCRKIFCVCGVHHEK